MIKPLHIPFTLFPFSSMLFSEVLLSKYVRISVAVEHVPAPPFSQIAIFANEMFSRYSENALRPSYKHLGTHWS